MCDRWQWVYAKPNIHIVLYDMIVSINGHISVYFFLNSDDIYWIRHGPVVYVLIKVLLLYEMIVKLYIVNHSIEHIDP